LTAFQEKYKDFRPTVIKADEQFSKDMMNEILIRNGLLPLSVALVDFHDVMELVLDAVNNKNASKVLEVYPRADEKLRAVEAISSEPGIMSIRANLDEVLSLAKENKTAELPARAGDLKASYVKVYLATS